MKQLIAFTVIVFTSYWIFKFLIQLMYKSKVEEKEQEPLLDNEEHELFEHFDFMYFKIANSELEYYAYCLDTDTLIKSTNMNLKYGNVTYEKVASVNLSKAAIVRTFISEKQNGFVQYQEVSEADFLHVFTSVANLSAHSFEPILNKQFN